MSHDHSHHHSEKKRVALISMVASGGLSLAKFVAALLTGSLGMLSEAIHSLVDMTATIVTWFAISWGDKPADHDHHYGHAKIENVAALFESFLLVGTAIFIAYEAIKRLLNGHADVEVTWWATAILIISMFIDFNRSRALRKTAKATSSAALAADAQHFEADMWSSLAALIGLVGVWYGWQWTDAVAGLLVSIFIATIGWKLGRQTIATLLDKAPEGATVDIRRLAEHMSGVLRVEQLRVRPVGSALFVSLTADVPRMMAITDIVALKDNLARETAGAAHSSCKIEHILLVFASAGQSVEIFFADNDMTGGAGHLPLAGAFQRLPGGLRDVEQAIACFAFNNLFLVAIGADEGHFDHSIASAARLMVAAAISISSAVV